MELLLLTSDPDPGSVLPALTLLPHGVRTAAQLTAVRARFVARTTTADGVRLSGTHLTDPEKPQVTALVHAHGFTHRTSYSATKRVLTAFAEHVDVVAFDLRGHGRSGGRNTVGDREVLDVDAAVAWARAAGYARVATVGFSLGAAVALRQAALGDHRVRPAGTPGRPWRCAGCTGRWSNPTAAPKSVTSSTPISTSRVMTSRLIGPPSSLPGGLPGHHPRR